MDFAALKTIYETQSDLFITDINPSEITLKYRPLNLTPVANPFVDQPKIEDEFGEQVNYGSLPDRIQESGNDLQQVNSSETIPCRIYWLDLKQTMGDPALSKINAALDNNIVKIITYVANMQKIINADYAIANDKNIKLIVPPTPYGLFGKQYCVSYWQTN